MGLRPLTVLSSSMEPALHPGDVVMVRAVDPADLQAGDVLTYLPPGSPAGALPVTHRLTGFTAGPEGSRELILQGDANALPDAPLPLSALQGRVVATLPNLGLMDLPAQRGDLAWIRPALALGMFGYAALLFFQHFRQRRSSRSRKGPTA